MRKIAILSMLIAGFMSASDAATPTQRRGRTAGTATTSTTASSQPVAARAAAGARTAPRAAAPATTSTSNTVVRGRSATPTATTAKPVAARAGTTQKVIATGTKVSTAAKNVVVSEECRAKYEGCMDAFCMLDNETGGRCICSDKNAEFDAILAEIEKLDEQSYKMATVGVERLEMGDDAEAAMSMAKSVADSLTEDSGKTSVSKRRSLDLSMWDTAVDFDEEVDVFGGNEDSIEGKEGDALYAAAAKLCAAQIPECGAELNLMKTLYGQKIRSDCAAYENTLKQQKNASAKKLAAAEQALRQTALDQYRSANKYDLGQCTVEFKKCMQNTGGCGEDFANCASVAAMDSTNTRKSTTRGTKAYQIKGAATTIEISASTYDALVAKKPLCESVTKSCVNVAGQVWDTFLREIAPQLKSAELIAEDNARQNCIGTISDCFQKACKDTMDPNDPDGSYDMCLSRPATMLNLCKVPLNACGIDATNEATAQASQIWEFVVARLASMRVDACTTQVKECMQSEDRCGADYSGCVGLDTDTIIRMCPYDKLTGCQQVYGEKNVTGEQVYDNIANMIRGLMLNIDNSLYSACQNAVNTAVISVCGSAEECNAIKVDSNLGARSLKLEICTTDGECFENIDMIPSEYLGSGENTEKKFKSNIAGTLPWNDIDLVTETIDDATGAVLPNEKQDNGMTYLSYVGAGVSDDQMAEMVNIDKVIATMVSQLESDEKVKQCIKGRTVQGMVVNNAREDLKGGARFPQLAMSGRSMIANAVFAAARQNYYDQYDKLVAQGLKELSKVATKIAEYDAIDAAHAQELENQTYAAEQAQAEAERQIAVAEAQKSVVEKEMELEKTRNEEKEKANKINKDNCLNSVGDNPTITGNTSKKDYSVNKKGTVYEEWREATWNPSTNTCSLLTRHRDCKNIKCNNESFLCKPRRCKDGKWGSWTEKTQEIVF